MEYRHNGLIDLAKALPPALQAANPGVAARELTPFTARLVASDVIYRDSFRDPAMAVLAEKKVTEAPITDPREAAFLPEDSPLVGTVGLSGVIERLTGQAVNASATGRQGTALVRVVALPAETELTEGSNANNELVFTPELALRVVLENQGVNQEPRIGVTVRIVGGAEDLSAQEFKGDAVDVAAGKEAQVDVPLDAPLPVGQPIELEVTSDPLPREAKTENNTKRYIITLTRA
jgi:hypothetical protein